jgi:hypothetical protein
VYPCVFALQGKPVVVMANKRDLPRAMPLEEIADGLNFPRHSIATADAVYVSPEQGAAAIKEALDPVLLPPLISLVLSYHTFPTNYLRIMPCTATADTDSLRAGMEWLVDAVYRRARASKPQSSSRCTLM